MKPTCQMILSNLLKSHAAQSRLYAEASVGIKTGEYTEEYAALWREEVKITQGRIMQLFEEQEQLMAEREAATRAAYE